MKKPDHQQFTVGEFTIYSHDYDGDVLQIVKHEENKQVDQMAMHETFLLAALRAMWEKHGAYQDNVLIAMRSIWDHGPRNQGETGPNNRG